jgi:lysophospholipase L1-like esterase
MDGPSGEVAMPGSTLTFTVSGPVDFPDASWLPYWSDLFDPQPLMRGSNGAAGNDESGDDTLFQIPPQMNDSGCYNSSVALAYEFGRYVATCTITLGKGPYYGTPAGQELPWTIFTAATQAGDPNGFTPQYNAGEWGPTSQFFELPVFIEPSPYAGFTVAKTGASFQFTDTTKSDLPITSWSWNFGDNETSTEENPLHTYAEPGSYPVTLVVTTSDGQTDTFSQTVTETQPHPRLTGLVEDLSDNGVQTTLTLTDTDTDTTYQIPTGTNGTYSKTLPVGNYELDTPASAPTNAFTPDSQTFDLTKSTTAETIIFNGYQLETSIVNGSNAPVPKVTVDVTGPGYIVTAPSGSDPNGFVTNASGNAIVEATPAIYTVTPVNPHPTQDVTFNPTSERIDLTPGDAYVQFQLVDDTPVVNLVTPNAGPVAGGAAIAISGNNFFQSGASVVTGVKFVGLNGKRLAAKSFSVLSDTAISAITPKALSILQPDATTIPTDVIVSTTKASSLKNTGDQFTFGDVPVVTKVSPNEGPYTGQSMVKADGQNFGDKPTLVLKLGTATLTPKKITVNSEGTQITFTVPALPSGLTPPQSADIVITTDDGSSPTGSADQFLYRGLNVVQLGDSIAAGEGINYGFTYDPSTQYWTSSSPLPVWEPPYPGCHVSDQAYGDLVAASLTNATFTTFACTGATYAAGVEGTEIANGELVPPQFGPWPNGESSLINQAYDAAEPDVVLVSLGADDIVFSDVTANCISNAYAHLTVGTPLECVKGNPGTTFESDFTANLPGVTSNLTQLANDITARGKASQSGIIPRVVFDDYYNPFPINGVTCPDTAGLYPSQLKFLSSAVLTLDSTIKATVDAVSQSDTNVSFAELKDVLSAGKGNQWCGSNPQAYGLSIEYTALIDGGNAEINPAPFHPTPAGQQAIANIVTPVVNTLVGKIKDG